MESLEEIRKQASSLRQSQKFSEALPLFKKLWEEGKNEKWDGWGYAFCLRKLGNYEYAIKVSEQIIKENPEFDYIKNIYVWSLYDYLSAKGDLLPLEKFLLCVEKILNYSSQDDIIYKKAVFKCLNKLKEQNTYDANYILELLNKLELNKLNQTSYTFEKDGKKVELASEYEQYFMHKTKALYKIKLYEKCIESCNLALKTINNFHYNNDIWFKWRIALCYKELQKYDSSLNYLQQIVKIKKDWFIQKEIAEIYFILKNFDKALSFALQSVMNFGDIDKKIHLIILLAEILEAKQMDYEAKLHFILANEIINENNWNINLPQKLINKYGNLRSNKLDVLKELKNLWSDIYFSNKTQYQGVISGYLPNNKAGFIKTDKQSYYFKTSEMLGKKAEFNIGSKVTFYLEDSYDPKKNKPVKNAVRIKIA
ncbi:tetratricopeptide repeat protein [Deferribacterales bacterium Es71-Z0220]|jgi:tetratricopeptide (TPR) repeat protein|uniref:tetratricopeptide repeat protein n=1 Tax=Deferrivibrio essentukiensis TaxID=2880922 RepID=UPI001F6063A1|nr:tetratricopeptide repeat protein [Deferrivibrio essentukiensis]MCB4205247.1 tetratricopeptide repeat protein [Deferrivibrio essentukiensis]